MFCRNCGSKLEDDAKICYVCGEKIQEYVTLDKNTERASNNAVEDILEKRETPTYLTNQSHQKYLNILFKIGFASAAFGAILFAGIVIVSLIGWGKVFLYDGYEFTAKLTTMSIIFMLFGIVVLTPVFIVNLKRKSINKLAKKVVVNLSIILTVLCVAFSACGLGNYVKEQDKRSNNSSGNSYGGSYNDYYSSGTDKSIGLSLKVDRVRTSGNYTYVDCTVTNVSSKYVATKYRYVKVKAQFKDRSGEIVDTDWTYAVDSAWLEPGESKTFDFMVKNTSIVSANLSFVD